MDFRKIKLILAPMEKVTNLPFRLLSHQYGADLVFTEMVHAPALARDIPQAWKLAQTIPDEKPVGIQFCGSDPAFFVKAAKKIESKFEVIDINMGCPSPNIQRAGAGAALLKNPEKITAIVSSLAKAVEIPITVKIRSNFAVRNAKLAEEAGAAAVTVHARTVMQGGKSKADWNVIKEVKEALSIPVFGNGGIQNPEDVQQMLKICDGAMIARAAIGDPFLFQRCKAFLEGENLMEDMQTKLKVFFEYCRLSEEYGWNDMEYFKKYATYCVSGFNHAKELRENINAAKSKEEIKMLFEAI